MKNITLAPTDILRLKVRFFFFFSSFFPFLKDVIHPLPQVAGDGRNVGRKRKHVMVVFCVFKEGRNVLKANHQHTVNLTVGSEDYDLMKVCEIAFLFVNEGTTPSCRNHLRTSSKTWSFYKKMVSTLTVKATRSPTPRKSPGGVIQLSFISLLIGSSLSSAKAWMLPTLRFFAFGVIAPSTKFTTWNVSGRSLAPWKKRRNTLSLQKKKKDNPRDSEDEVPRGFVWFRFLFYSFFWTFIL